MKERLELSDALREILEEINLKFKDVADGTMLIEAIKRGFEIIESRRHDILDSRVGENHETIQNAEVNSFTFAELIYRALSEKREQLEFHNRTYMKYLIFLAVALDSGMNDSEGFIDCPLF